MTTKSRQGSADGTNSLRENTTSVTQRSIGGREIDPGYETLRRMASVDRYNQWIFEEVRSHLGQRVLEVGCGLGNMTPYLCERDSVVSIDLLAASVAHVRNLYGLRPNLKLIQGDICDERLVGDLAGIRFDTVVCVNVLEHIADDRRALKHMQELLDPGGKLVLFVPAGRYLYGHLDRALGHHRRYDLRSLCSTVDSLGLRVEVAYYMNLLGVPGWFLASRVLRRSTPPRSLLRLYNAIAPPAIKAERLLRPSFGQSILCVASR